MVSDTISFDRIFDYLDKSDGKIVLGIDGNVDEVWQIVALRRNRDDYKLFDKMKDFAGVVYDTGEGGIGYERIQKRHTYGGFVANTGKAVGELGTKLTLVGMFGKNEIYPVFQGFQDAHEVISIREPVVTEIFEFIDGKLMLSNLEGSAEFNWENLINAVPMEVLRPVFREADIVGLGYWAVLHNFDELVSNICEHFLIDSAREKCTRMFFDLADFKRREWASLEKSLYILAELNEKIPMILSLNEHEAMLLYSHMGRKFDWEKIEYADKGIEYIRQRTGLDELIIHTPYFAVAATASEGTAIVEQRRCQSPVITTGAGDTFNGGYLVAGVKRGKLNLQERLLVANATTGFYVRNGRTPNRDDLKNEIADLSF